MTYRIPALALASSLCLFASFATAAPTALAPEDGTAVDEVSPEPSPHDVWVARPVVVLGHVQTLGPLGIFGLSAEYSFNPYFSTGLGIGTNGSTQGAMMARFRLPLDDHFGAGVGIGASYGRPFTIDLNLCFEAPCKKPDPLPAVVSGDTEIYVEGRTTGGFTARLYGGVHQQLDGDRRMNGYFGIGGGWSF